MTIPFPFEWHPEKNIKNQEKHGIRFEDAIEVFYNPMVNREDNKKDYGEVRYIGIGKDKQGICYTIIYTYRGDKTRIISARKSKKKERLEFEDYKGKHKVRVMRGSGMLKTVPSFTLIMMILVI